LRDAIIDYGTKLLRKPHLRRREMTAQPLIDAFDQQPASVMEKLEPQKTYAIDDLVRWVNIDSSYDGVRNDFVEALTDASNKLAHSTTVHSVSQRLHMIQTINYRPAVRTRRLQCYDRENPGVVQEIGRELQKNLEAAGHNCESRHIYHAINSAANTLFKIPAHENGPMDQPAYHIAILGRYRKALQKIAYGKLIDDGMLGQALKTFAYI
jgi:hypothetical protein